MKHKQKIQTGTFSKSNLLCAAASGITFLFLLGISFINYRRAGSFAFVDEYYTFVAARFLENGRTLYSQIFSHHQPLPVFLSFGIQKILNPQSLYQLIMYHREFMIAYSFGWFCVFIARFKYLGIGFALLLAPLSYYFFGHLFLAESFVVYPLSFLAITAWQNVSAKPLSWFDMLFSAFCFWLIIWMREPFIPVSTLLFGLILWHKKQIQLKLISVGFVAVLSLLMLYFLPIHDYVNSLIGINFGGYIQHEATSNGLTGISAFKIFLYPFLIPFARFASYPHLLLSGLSLAFSVTFILFLKKGHWKKGLFALLILGLSNLRYVDSNAIFFNGFHLLPWLGLFICFELLMLQEITPQYSRKITALPISILVLTFLAMFLPQKSYVFEHANRAAEFDQNYSTLTTRGQTVQILSKPRDTFYIETWELLSYWNSGLDSSAPYAIFLPVMNSFPIYQEARTDMFQKNPPTFYNGVCFDNKNYVNPIPKSVQSQYTELMLNGEHSCLYVKKTRLQTASPHQITDIAALGYTKPTK